MSLVCVCVYIYIYIYIHIYIHTSHCLPGLYIATPPTPAGGPPILAGKSSPVFYEITSFFSSWCARDPVCSFQKWILCFISSNHQRALLYISTISRNLFVYWIPSDYVFLQGKLSMNVFISGCYNLQMSDSKISKFQMSIPCIIRCSHISYVVLRFTVLRTFTSLSS